MSSATTFCEYIWIDGSQPTQKLRSKTKVLRGSTVKGIKDFPDWGFDGSSTGQAEGRDSDCVLRPCNFVPDPTRTGNAYLVLCEVFNPDGVTPHASNTRSPLSQVLRDGANEAEPWFGIEQEYTLLKNGRILGWPERGYPPPQGPFYCGVGADEIAGRTLVEEHMQACVKAGLLYEGCNFEVLLGQAEFQIGAADPLTVADHLWFARWLLYRLGENHGISATLHPKPVQGDWNGTGAHVNVSTASMRICDHLGISAHSKVRHGLPAIKQACEKMGERVAEHLAVYGADNQLRLTGRHETCDINTFRWGVADRGASIRIPRHVATEGGGYFEDRRPAANADPYQVCTVILKTICDLW